MSERQAYPDGTQTVGARCPWPRPTQWRSCPHYRSTNNRPSGSIAAQRWGPCVGPASLSVALPPPRNRNHTLQVSRHSGRPLTRSPRVRRTVLGPYPRLAVVRPRRQQRSIRLQQPGGLMSTTTTTTVHTPRGSFSIPLPTPSSPLCVLRWAAYVPVQGGDILGLFAGHVLQHHRAHLGRLAVRQRPDACRGIARPVPGSISQDRSGAATPQIRALVFKQ